MLDDARRAATEALLLEAGGPAWDEAGLARLRDHVAGGLAERTLDARPRAAISVLDAAREVRERLERPVAPTSSTPSTTCACSCSA